MSPIATLILVNGPPAVGKTTLARRYLDDHPLALLLDIDAIRVTLGRWQDHDESKLLARSLALAMAEAHLRAGREVIVPQYLGRPEFIDALDQLALHSGAGFVETLVMDRRATVTERFHRRRAELATSGGAHPQGDVDELAVAALIADAFERLRAIEAQRPRTRVIQLAGGIEGGYQALRQAVRESLR